MNIEQVGQTEPVQWQCRAKKQGGVNSVATKCPVMKGFNRSGQIIVIYCGLWTCERCSKHLSRMWAWRVKLHVETSKGDAYFWTLTLRGRYKTAEQGFKALPHLWDTFRKLVQRKIGKWSYCAFVEGQPQRDYMPHFHIISMSKSPGRLKDIAFKAGFGFQAKEKKISGPGAANYVAKYASKQSDKTPKNFRRVRASRDWAKLPETSGVEYLVKSRSETVGDFLLRVHDETGVEIELLYQRWADAHQWED